MNNKIVRSIVALVGFTVFANFAAAQNSEQHGIDALNVYYTDLNQKLSTYAFSDIPFKHTQVKVRRNDSLLEIARQHRFQELDFFHLAAALYETNPQVFETADASVLKAGTIITMPTVWEIHNAQDRYEKLKVIGDGIDFTNQDNLMRKAQRWPFGKSLLLIGPYARDELPRNQLVTLTSYRPDALSINENSGSGFLSAAANAAALITGPSLTTKAPADTFKTDGSWLDKPATELPIADTFLLDNTPEPTLTKSNDLIDALRFPDVQVDATAEAMAAAEASVMAEANAKANSDATLLAEAPTRKESVKKPTKQALAAVDKRSDVKAKTIAIAKAPASNREKVKPVAAPANKELVIAAAIPPVNTTETRPLSAVKNNPYLGPPRNTAGSTASTITTDPLSYSVEWAFQNNATVGTAINQLAEYIGYELISDDDIVHSTYTRKLPALQRNVSGVTAEEGFAILAGKGLQTVFDHVSRSVKHIPKQQKAAALTTAAADNAPIIQPAPAINTSKPTPAVTAGNIDTHTMFLQQTGISDMLKKFPNDIESAIDRHTNRCSSTANNQSPDAARLHNTVISRLQQRTPEPLARQLVEWYESPTGLKVRELERLQIDNDKLQQFTIHTDREDRIQQIYSNTETGKVLASVAVVLDYAGWSLSGCKEKAESSGDVDQMHKEMIHGQVVKKEAALEEILKEDTMHSMAYLFSALSDRELTEFAEVTQRHAGVYSELQQSIVDAIKLETKEINVSSLD